MNEILIILALLFTKHLIVDFPLQKPYQYLNKGKYGHLGGILHSSLHALGTMLVLVMFTPSFIILGLLDGIIHYHIDWSKMNLNQKMGWGPTTHEEFWWLLGLDQYLHALTYLGILLLI